MAPVKPSPPLATVLRLQPNSAFWSAPPRLVHLKSLSAMIRSGQRTFPVSSENYLAASLSLSPESEEALSIAKFKPYIIKSTVNADSVIELFKDYGFSNTQMAKIFSMRPRLLTYNPHKLLKPKLDFLAQICISGDTLVHILTNDPYILDRSLRKQIVPSIEFLQSLFINNAQDLASFLLNKRASWIFRHFSDATIPANAETLRRHGVPDSNILRLILIGGVESCLARDTESFNDKLREIVDMGFDLSSPMFLIGLRVFCRLSKEKWASKIEVINKCFGWSDDRDRPVLALFRKLPTVMLVSEEKLRQGLEIFTNRLGWEAEYITKYPTLLTSSINKRILPRISVLEMLQSKGLVENAINGNAFMMKEDKFLSLYVNKYQQDLPQVQLMEIYTKSMRN